MTEVLNYLWTDRGKRVPKGEAWKFFTRMKLPDPHRCLPNTFMGAAVSEMQTLLTGSNQQSTRGRLFELAFEAILLANHIDYRAQENFGIEAVNIDYVSEQQSIHYCFSLKTSFRERWRQIELESRVLKEELGRRNVLAYAIRTKALLEKGDFTSKMPSVDRIVCAELPELNEILRPLL